MAHLAEEPADLLDSAADLDSLLAHASPDACAKPHGSTEACCTGHCHGSKSAAGLRLRRASSAFMAEQQQPVEQPACCSHGHSQPCGHGHGHGHGGSAQAAHAQQCSSHGCGHGAGHEQHAHHEQHEQHAQHEQHGCAHVCGHEHHGQHEGHAQHEHHGHQHGQHGQHAAHHAAHGKQQQQQQQHPEQQGGEPQLDRTTRVFCAGICCPMETPLVHSVLGGLPGVRSVDVSVMSQTVSVKHDASRASPAALVAALNGAMLDASLTPPRRQAQVRGRWLPPWHVLAGACLLAASLLHCLAGAATWLPAWLDQLEALSLASAALCLPRIALRAALALRRGVVDVHLLVTIAACGAIALADWAEAAAVAVLFALAEHWERCSTERARDAVQAVLTLRPESAKLAASGATVAVEEVPPGTQVLVAPGEAVPLDGEVLAGESAMDENLLTGESTPVLRGPGSTVRAGTLNVGSAVLLVRTTAAAGDTAVARMAALVEAAASQQSPAEALVAQFARVYTPLILLLCLAMAALPWLLLSDPAAQRRWAYLSLQVLVTACPCALVLSTPATVVCALARAAQHGVLIKGGAALEALRRVSVVTLDKTGTLTKGSFQLVGCHPRPGWAQPHLLRLLGSLERGSSHPLAAAVLGYAAAQGIACDASVEEAQAVPGAGITALVDGRRVAAGTPALLASAAGVAGAEVAAAQAALEAEGATGCFVAVDGQLAGWVSARDVVRPEAAEAVELLDRLGCTAVMLTGDAPAAAAAVGAVAGIPPKRIHARLLPEDKLAKVAAYQRGADAPAPAAQPLWHALQRLLPRQRRRQQRVWVAHVGDGVNDAPALAAADAGIAMGVAGSAAALEAGSVALFVNDVRAVPAALMLARTAGATIWQNIAFAVLTKVAVLLPAAVGRFSLWGAVFVDVGSSLLVVANALRLLHWRWPVAASQHAHSHHHHHHHHKHHKHSHCGGGACCGSHEHEHGAGHGSSGGQCCGHNHKHSHGGGGGNCCGHSHGASQGSSGSGGSACCGSSHAHTHHSGHSGTAGHSGSCCPAQPVSSHSDCCGQACSHGSHGHAAADAAPAACCSTPHNQHQQHQHQHQHHHGDQPHRHSHAHGQGCCGHTH